jgi:hypothetical protein
VSNVADQRSGFARGQGLFQSIDGVQVARGRADQVERPVELDIGDRLFLIGDVNLRDRLVGLVLESDAGASVKGPAIRIDVDAGIHRSHFELQQVFILFELAFVIRLNVTPRLGVEVFVENMGIVEVPAACASGDDGEEQSERRQAGSYPEGQPSTGAQRILRSAPGQGDRDHSQEGHDREPIGD